MSQYQSLPGFVRRELKAEILRFVVVGAISTAINYALFLMLFMTGAGHLPAAAAGFLAGTLAGFHLNRSWTFGHRSRGALGPYLLVYATSMGTGLLALDWLVGTVGLHAPLANVLVIALTTCMNFAGARTLVFRTARPVSSREILDIASGRTRATASAVDALLRHKGFRLGVALKIAVILLPGSSVMAAMQPAVSAWLHDVPGAPYATHGDVFPYPALMLYGLAGPVWLAELLTDHGAGAAARLVLHAPLLAADTGIAVVLARWCRHDVGRVVWLYWLSPVMLWITYVESALDVLPVGLMFVGLYGLFRERLVLAAVAFAAALACKVPVMLALPFMYFYMRSQKLPPAHIAGFFLVVVGVAVLLNAAWLGNGAFHGAVLAGPAQLQVLDMAAVLRERDVLYLIPALYCLLLFRAASLRMYSQSVLLLFAGFTFGMIVLLLPPAAGWYLWVLPFFIYHAVRQPGSTGLLIALQLAWLVHFADVVPATEVWPVAGVSPAIVSGATFTLMQTALLINCLWLYSRGIRSVLRERLSARPILIGIGGGSGAGKSTFTEALSGIFGARNTTVVRGDDMHKWERGHEKWREYTHLDPRANHLHAEYACLRRLKDGGRISRRHYNHSNGRFDPCADIEASRVNIFEGLHPFYLARLRELYDFRIFIRPEEQLLCHWKIIRDTTQRSYTRAQILQQIEMRREDARRYIDVQADHADMVIEMRLRRPILLPGNRSERVDAYLRLTLANSFYIEPVVDELRLCPGLRIEHSYGDNDRQHLDVDGRVPAEVIEDAARRLLPELEQMGVFYPQWQGDHLGVAALVATWCIFQEIGSDRT